MMGFYILYDIIVMEFFLEFINLILWKFVWDFEWLFNSLWFVVGLLILYLNSVEGYWMMLYLLFFICCGM